MEAKTDTKYIPKNKSHVHEQEKKQREGWGRFKPQTGQKGASSRKRSHVRWSGTTF